MLGRLKAIKAINKVDIMAVVLFISVDIIYLSIFSVRNYIE